MAASPRCTRTRPHGTPSPPVPPPWPRGSGPGPRLWGLPPDTPVLTSVCALGSPALAFSSTSSKGASLSPFAGPVRGKRTSQSRPAGRGREDSRNSQAGAPPCKPGREVSEDSHVAPQGGGRTPPAVSSGSAVSGRLGRAGPQSRVPPPPWAPCLAAVLGGPPQYRACTRGPAPLPHRPKARLLRLQSVQPQSVGVHSEKRLYHRVTTHPPSSCGGIYIPGARKARWGGSQAARGFPVPSLYRGSCTTRCGIVGAVLPADHQPRHPTERLPL